MFGKLWYILTLRCEEADRLRSRQQLEPLTRVERVAMSLHQLICKSCRIAARQLQILDAALSRLRDAVTDASPVADSGPRLSPDARERIAKSLRDADSSGEKSE